MQKWDYKVIYGNTDETILSIELESEGKEGWELVAVTMTGVTPVLYFKRPSEVLNNKYN
jgi:hypothetical protein